MSRHRPHRALSMAVAGLALVLLAPLSRSQEVCRTPNCGPAGTVPAACADRATPRAPVVRMTSSGLTFLFDPSEPRIEPGDCIEWRAATVTHSSSENGCPDDSLCGSPSPSACLWDSGNVSSTAATPSVVCRYAVTAFPAGTADPFYCRLHATPTTGTMRGTLRVTSAIVLAMDKQGTDVVLEWTGGGVSGDETFKVVRSDAGDPKFPAESTSTSDPDGGVAGRTFHDIGELSNGLARFYLVRNKQPNE